MDTKTHVAVGRKYARFRLVGWSMRYFYLASQAISEQEYIHDLSMASSYYHGLVCGVSSQVQIIIDPSASVTWLTLCVDNDGICMHI